LKLQEKTQGMRNQTYHKKCGIAKAVPIISLFSGAGGLDLGFKQAGFKTILAIDNHPAACQTFMFNNRKCDVLRMDLATIDPKNIIDRISDLPQENYPAGVIGGPPCQAFSFGNVYKKAHDARSLLPSHYAAHLGALRRKFEIDFFVFENVPGLNSRNHEVLFSELKGLFEKAGFIIQEDVLDAVDFGVPQRRQRIFVVGFNRRKHRDISFSFPIKSQQSPVTVREVLGGLPDPVYFTRDLTADRIPFHPNHWCMRPRSAKFLNGHLTCDGNGNKGRPFRVLDWDSASRTVAYGHREVHVHPSGKRRLSVYEAMLLQGFPQNYRLFGNLSQQITLVSDAVPPPVGRALAERIRESLYARGKDKDASAS
jgi:DNA (cytosine-5)-methyltransferase 1